MKNKFKYLGVLGVFFGMGLSKTMVTRYGANSRVVILSIALMISIVALIGLLCMKQYVAAIASFFMFILPGTTIFIGVYLDNIFIASVGFVLIFIFIPITIKILPKYKK